MGPDGNSRGHFKPQNSNSNLSALCSSYRFAEVCKHQQTSHSACLAQASFHHSVCHKAAQISNSLGNPLSAPSCSINCPRGSVLTSSAPS